MYDLDAWAKVLFINFTLKNCFFRGTDIVKYSDKEKYVYSGYRIAFDGDGKGEQSFGDEYTRNVIIFGADNCSSSNADNHKNYFLISGEGDTLGINDSFRASEKNLVLILVNQTQAFA